MGKEQEIAKTVSNWTVESKSMLPKSPEEIMAFLTEGKGILILNGAGGIAGFGAVTFDWPDN